MGDNKRPWYSTELQEKWEKENPPSPEEAQTPEAKTGMTLGILIIVGIPACAVSCLIALVAQALGVQIPFFGG